MSFGSNTVVIIIGILASIAIPVFLGQREDAYNNATRSQLSAAASAQSVYQVNNGSYAGGADTLAGANIGFKKSGEIPVTVVSTADAPDAYCMSAKHSSGGNTYYMTQDRGTPTTTSCT